jgi:hypothetical protein
VTHRKKRARRKIMKSPTFFGFYCAHNGAIFMTHRARHLVRFQAKETSEAKQPDKFMLIFITSVFEFLAAACMCAIETHLPQPDGRHQTLPLDEGASCHNPRRMRGQALTQTLVRAARFQITKTRS